ncbi:two-component system chemotaxis sensor kinase CheA [Keratinibaculum paraultunense]|uniref:Chemotaxis protein CheA n=1 Tax=Keratinibaculum paraultunense TaxID=1278232 RepID=A0A4R3KWG6_9FIRM|nr:chemotaxis protein CheA [Keratinibaculum paraultunense]QQY80715.1 chemotaxis protein CheA [Keratinibaculum paraultunense]TCS89680.1 two-component system chemotaxis sensor kinase CheA [Keratinibaculum paraultunense]
MDLDFNQYIDIFVEETKEHLQLMNESLLELEKDINNKALIDEIFRVAHTLKGMAGTMGFTNISNLTHEMENVFQEIRNNTIELNENIIDLIFECFDALDYSVNFIAENGEEDEESYDDLINRLQAIINKDKNKESINKSDKSNIQNEAYLNQYTIKAIKEAKEKGLNSYKITINLNPQCMLKSARAFIVFNTLESIGDIIYSNPPVEDIEDEKFDLSFTVVLISNVDKEKIQKEIENISEIDDVNIVEIDYEYLSKQKEDKQLKQLDEYTLNIIEEAKEKGLNSYKITINLNPQCMLKSARAFIVFNTLEPMGDIIYSNPPVEDIEDEKFDLSFEVIFITKANKDEIKKALEGIAEVDNVSIVLMEHADRNREKESKITKKDTERKSSTSTSNSKDKKSNIIKREKRIGKTVRVDIDRLDNLMNLVSELIIIKTRMDDLSESSNKENMIEAIEYLERITTSLHDAVMKVRMVPVERVFNRFPRMVRDLSKELNKEIKLQMLGEETEVDRTVIDEIGDPLIHIIRNSIDHGIEMPEERIKLGKPKEGTVILKAYPDGNNVVIEVIDDGRGIDSNKIKDKAIQKGIITEQEGEMLSEEEILALLFTPGFSTSEKVSDISGRGVGLDVVKSKIESINGSVEIETKINVGTKFIIRIPLTLAIIQALLVKLNDEIYAIPLSSITEITDINKEDIRNIQGQEIMLYRGKTIPVVRLNRILNINFNEDVDEYIAVVVHKGEKQAGLLVDSLIGQQEIVIKPMGKYLSNIKYISGATILGNGSISLILDTNSLI